MQLIWYMYSHTCLAYFQFDTCMRSSLKFQNLPLCWYALPTRPPLISLFSGCTQSFQTLAPRRDTLDPVLARNLTVQPATCPEGYSLFPNGYKPFFAVPSLGPASFVTTATMVRFPNGCVGWTLSHEVPLLMA